MTNTTVKMMIAAAAMAVAAGTASAQGLKADVPFQFSTGSKVMNAGSYSVTLNSSRQIATISSNDAKEAATVVAYGLDTSNVRGEAKLVFSCWSGRCDLVAASTGEGGYAYSVTHPRSKSGAALMEIKLHR